MRSTWVPGRLPATETTFPTLLSVLTWTRNSSTTGFTLSITSSLCHTFNRHLHIDAAKLEGTGFKCEVPGVTVPLLREVGVVPTGRGVVSSGGVSFT